MPLMSVHSLSAGNVRSAASTQRFGNRSNPYDAEAKKPDPQKFAKEMTSAFVTPKPQTWLQKILFKINRKFVLPQIKKIQVDLLPADLAKLKALPANAGNMMVAAHPDMDDGSVMFSLNSAANRMPAGFFMASEIVQQTPKFLRPFWKMIGAISIQRGKPNPEAIEYLSDRISQGGWGGIFPEGSVYLSRNVMPMEYGAVKIAVEAALKAQATAKSKGGKPAPVYLTPYAHVYQHTDREQMKANMAKALKALEERPELFGPDYEGEKKGTLVERIKSVANRVLEAKALEYKLPTDGWDQLDAYGRAEALQKSMIESLEMKYLGALQEGFVRRRALKVRMSIFEELKKPGISAEKKEELNKAKNMAMDVISLVMFERDYKYKYNDMETWGEFLRRLQSGLGMECPPFGKRKAIVRLMPLQDMHPVAEAYAKLTTEDEQKQFLFDLTEKVRQDIQVEIEKICKDHPVPPLD